MKIGINAHKLSFEPGFRQAGTSRYIEALLQELPKIAAEDEIIAFTGRVPAEWPDRFPRINSLEPGTLPDRVAARAHRLGADGGHRARATLQARRDALPAQYCPALSRRTYGCHRS